MVHGGVRQTQNKKKVEVVDDLTSLTTTKTKEILRSMIWRRVRTSSGFRSCFFRAPYFSDLSFPKKSLKRPFLVWIGSRLLLVAREGHPSAEIISMSLAGGAAAVL
jgi:hypothetical protein